MTQLQPIDGLHHVTVMSGDPEANVRFFRDALGLRLVKRTVNFDDAGTYHLYYGDETGQPGTAYTVFPFGEGRRGPSGTGEVSATGFAVPAGSIDYWRDRLSDADASVREPETRFGSRVLPFTDPDGQELELVETDAFGSVEPWDGSPVPAEHQIRGFHSVSLRLADAEPTADLLEFMGFDRVDEAGDRVRFRGAGDHAAVVDLVERPDAGRAGNGIGSVHHVAFSVPDDETQTAWQAALRDRGLHATEVKDRQYFRSIYFREPGGVLFEFATDGPGFTADESVAELGSGLRLPEWLEDDRDRIESALPELDVFEASDDGAGDHAGDDEAGDSAGGDADAGDEEVPADD
ncbi:ring-cleaving dioxygenase [Halobaculum sp. P14]|uniref:ring-cleaving dioxygenase n=1 Tax=Halobaculum sp. P14 TaxID=3421638 RepID=UPI003EBEC196